MAWAVLVRAANVGGRVFRPSELVARLVDLQLVSIGAAGTFAVGAGVAESAVRRRIADALPFAAEIMVVPAGGWHAYVRARSGDVAPAVEGARRYVTVAASPIEAPRRMPLRFPDTADWGVTVDHIDGPFVTGWYRRRAPRPLYPNAVVEKEFGVAATTRWWETALALDHALGRGGGGTPRTGPTRGRPVVPRRAPRRERAGGGGSHRRAAGARGPPAVRGR